MIKQLKELKKSGVKELEIYYAEIIDDPKIWSVDVMNDYLNNNCAMAWTWTVLSSAENEINKTESPDCLLADYEIVVYDKNFSDDVVCEAINSWLIEHGLENLRFKIKMIQLESAEPYSGYVKNLYEMDLDDAIENAVPLEKLDLDGW